MPQVSILNRPGISVEDTWRLTFNCGDTNNAGSIQGQLSYRRSQAIWDTAKEF
jgi:hypothetical protein